MIFFLYGDDTFRSTEKLNQLKEKFSREVDQSGYNILFLDGESLTLDKFNEAVKQTGFLSVKRLIIIKNIFNNKKLKDFDEEIINYLNDQKDSMEENYLIFWAAGVPKKTLPLVKKLLGFKYVFESKNLTPTETAAWLKNKINAAGGKIEPAALKKIVAYLGNNLWEINNEMDKLLAYKKTAVITMTDVEQLIKIKNDDNIFNLTDAIAGKNKKLALKLINEQLSSGVNQIYLLTMVVRQFRILIELKSLSQKYDSYQRITGQTDLHPFVIKKTWPLLPLFNPENLKDIYHRLLTLETQLKSTRYEPVLLFDKFIAEL